MSGEERKNWLVNVGNVASPEGQEYELTTKAAHT
jgi:hypothetical protein